MKRLLITAAFLLAYAGAFAQGEARTAKLTHLYLPGPFAKTGPLTI